LRGAREAEGPRRRRVCGAREERRGRRRLKAAAEASGEGEGVFSYAELLPLGQDATSYKQLSSDGVTARSSFGRNFLEIEPQVLTLLTSAAMHDIAHLLRPAHLRQLRSILDDPEASPNDRYVARDLLKNACIAAGGVLPMCQDTGTAIVMGKRGQHVLTDGRDSEHISRGVYDAYTTLNLRYSQLAPLTMWEEKNT